MSEPVGQTIARAWETMKKHLEAGTVVAHELCRCKPDTRLTEQRPGVFVALFLHDDWCPVVGGKGAP